MAIYLNATTTTIIIKMILPSHSILLKFKPHRIIFRYLDDKIHLI